VPHRATRDAVRGILSAMQAAERARRAALSWCHPTPWKVRSPNLLVHRHRSSSRWFMSSLVWTLLFRRDALTYLQGLVTNDVKPLESAGDPSEVRIPRRAESRPRAAPDVVAAAGATDSRSVPQCERASAVRRADQQIRCALLRTAPSTAAAATETEGPMCRGTSVPTTGASA
jgi:hypothetical protein